MYPLDHDSEISSELNRRYITLVIFNALIDHVTPNLRLVSAHVDRAGKKLHVHLYYDGPIDDVTKECSTGIIDEIACHFSSIIEAQMETQVERLDFPAEIKYGGWPMFIRYEPKIDVED